ncbi:MAG: O-antigen ligase family protein [Bacteroidota bacterium]
MKKTKVKAAPILSPKTAKSSYEDFMVLFFVAAFLLIDFLPYFETFEIIAPQFFYLTILNILTGIYIYNNPVLHETSLLAIFKKSYVFKIYLAFIILCGISIITAKNLSLGVLSIAEILVGFTMFLNFAILLYNRMHLIYKVAFFVGVSAFFQAGIALYNFEIIARSKSVSDALNSNFLKGNTGNINILAASLVFKIPFIFIGVINYNKWKKWFLAAALLMATIIIFLISARASLLSLIVITSGFLVYYLKTGGLKQQIFLQTLYIVIPIFVSFSVVNIIFKQSKSEGRYASTTARLKQINAEDGSINARLHYYKNAIALTKKSPFLGIGLGNYRVESIPYELRTNSSISLHAHNDFLELTAETGVLNGVLYFSIFVALLFINVKRLIKTPDREIRNIALLTLLLLVVYGLDALFNFPFYRPTMQVCLSFIIAFTLINVVKEKVSTQLNKKQFLSLILLAIIPLYFTYHSYKTSNLEYLIQTDNINFASSGFLKGDDVVNRNPKFPNVFQTSESFVEFAGIYYFREKKYDKAINFLDSANKINPHTGRPDFYKFLIAKEIGEADSAYVYIKRAFYNRPVNDTFYEHAIGVAAGKKDTVEIFNMYDEISSHIKSAGTWQKTANSLQMAGLSVGNFNKFIAKGLKDFPKDSVVAKKINDMAITDLIEKGQNLFAAGKFDQALKTYQKALKIDATNIYVMQNIGFYYYNLGKPNVALPYFKNALALPGLSDGKTQFFIGMCYISIGDKNNGCKYFKEAGGYPDAPIQLALNCK